MMNQSLFGNFKRGGFRVVLGLILVEIALYRLLCIGMEYRKGAEAYHKLEQSFVIKAETDSESARAKDKDAAQEPGTGGQHTGADTQAGFDYSIIQIDFEKLKSINEDIIGWLMFDYNGISYPILQGRDNREYLYTLADKTKNDAGSIFMEALCTPDFEDMHTILYGHNRKDLTMFGKLKKYGTQAGYYEENRYFTVYTPKGFFRYEIFAWYEAAEDDAVYQVGFKADEAFAEFTAQMKKRSYQDTGVPAGKEDKIITLSTCSLAGRRFVVHGKRIGGGE